jgi:hypothetical protein
MNHHFIALNDEGSKQVSCVLWYNYFGNGGEMLFCRRN